MCLDNKQLTTIITICQRLSISPPSPPIPDCAEVRASLAPLSQVTFPPLADLSLTSSVSSRRSGLLHLQVLPEDRQQAVHVGEERLRDDPERRVHHHPLRGQLRRAHGAVRLCLHQRPGEQGER